MPECCCRPYDPEKNLVVRCWPRALDMGHCKGDDFAAEFCCGGTQPADIEGASHEHE